MGIVFRAFYSKFLLSLGHVCKTGVPSFGGAPFRIILGPFRDLFWDPFGDLLPLLLSTNCYWDHFGIRFGTVLGSFWDFFETSQNVLAPPVRPQVGEKGSFARL